MLLAVWFDTGLRKTPARLTTNGGGAGVGARKTLTPALSQREREQEPLHFRGRRSEKQGFPRRGIKSGRVYEEAGHIAQFSYEGVHDSVWRVAAISSAMALMDLAVALMWRWACW